MNVQKLTFFSDTNEIILMSFIQSKEIRFSYRSTC